MTNTSKLGNTGHRMTDLSEGIDPEVVFRQNYRYGLGAVAHNVMNRKGTYIDEIRDVMGWDISDQELLAMLINRGIRELWIDAKSAKPPMRKVNDVIV